MRSLLHPREIHYRDKMIRRMSVALSSGLHAPTSDLTSIWNVDLGDLKDTYLNKHTYEYITYFYIRQELGYRDLIGTWNLHSVLSIKKENLNVLKLFAFNLHNAGFEGVIAKPGIPYNTKTTMTLWVSVEHTIKMCIFASKN